MTFICIEKSLLWGVVFEIIMHVYETFTPEMYSWTAISSLKKVINAII
jgi:hypothetical protein